jgi:hypothetical protein
MMRGRYGAYVVYHLLSWAQAAGKAMRSDAVTYVQPVVVYLRNEVSLD